MHQPGPYHLTRVVDIEGQLLTFSELIERLEQTVEGQEDCLAEPLMPRRWNHHDAKFLDVVRNTRRSIGKSQHCWRTASLDTRLKAFCMSILMCVNGDSAATFLATSF